MKYPNKKALMLLIDKTIHHEIKSRSSLIGMSMTDFIVMALMKEFEDQNNKGWPAIQNEKKM